MESEIDISIIVPSFQQGRFIRECLESILSQADVRLEVIVFDAESTDETRRILSEFQTKIECVIEKDLGQANAINKGLSRCKGRIIGYLNSDDALAPGALSNVIDCWDKDPTIDLLYGNAKYIDESSSIIGDYRTMSWNWDKFRGECFICQPAAFWSRRIMKHIGFFDERLKCSMDYDYWIRIVQSGGSIRHVDNYLAYSRDYSSTKTRSLRSTVFSENFKISLNRIGEVHPFWVCQYLDYFKYEIRPWWSSIIPPRGRSRDLVTRFASLVSKAFARDVISREFRSMEIV